MLLLGVASAPRFADTPEAIPIETVSLSELNQIANGEKDAKPAPPATPSPPPPPPDLRASTEPTPPQPAPTRVGPDDNFIAAQEQALNRAAAEEASENDAEAASEINRPVDNAR